MFKTFRTSPNFVPYGFNPGTVVITNTGKVVRAPSTASTPITFNLTIVDPSGVDRRTILYGTFSVRQKGTSEVHPLQIDQASTIYPSSTVVTTDVLWSDPVSQSLSTRHEGEWELLVSGLADAQVGGQNIYAPLSKIGTFQVDLSSSTPSYTGPNLSQGTDSNTTYFGALTELPIGWKSGSTPLEFLDIGLRIPGPGTHPTRAHAPHTAYVESPRIPFTDNTTITVHWLTANQNSQVTLQGDPLLIEPMRPSLWYSDGVTSPSPQPKAVRVVMTREETVFTETVSVDMQGDGTYVQIGSTDTELGFADFADFHLYLDAVTEDLILQNVQITTA